MLTKIKLKAAAVLAFFLAVLAFGKAKERSGSKSKEQEMRLRDHEQAKYVRRRADVVRVSKDDIKYRD